MKRLAIILLIGVYLILSVGIGKSTHFCMGREHHSSLFSFESKKCACSVYAATKNCCKDETELVKIIDDQTTGKIIQSNLPDLILIGTLFTTVSNLGICQIKVNTAEDYIFPPPKIPIYQSVCSLVFYDSQV